MLSAYVKSSFENVSDSNKTASRLLVPLSPDSRFRLMGIQFIPSENGEGTSSDAGAYFRSGVELSMGVSGDPFFKDQIYPGTLFSSWKQPDFENISMMSILPHGILSVRNEDPSEAGVTEGVYFKGTGKGINFISITYQVG